jgi:hypothetical protein
LKRRDDRIEEHNRLKLQVRRHKRVTGDIWGGFDNGSAKKSAKERHKERLRRIKLNKDAGEERGLQMNIIPLADQFARRQKLMVKELEHSVVVRKKHTPMRNMVVDRSDGQNQEINTAVSQYFSVSPKGKRNVMGTLSSVLAAKQKFLRSQKNKKKRKKKGGRFPERIGNRGSGLVELELTNLPNTDEQSLGEIYAVLLRIKSMAALDENNKTYTSQRPSVAATTALANSIERKLVELYGVSTSSHPAHRTNKFSQQQQQQQQQPRKSFHFDSVHERYFSYNQDTREKKWEDPTDVENPLETTEKMESINPMMTEHLSMSVNKKQLEAMSYKSNPMLNISTSSKTSQKTTKSRKSYHFDKNQQSFYSFDEDTKATVWEDPPDKMASESKNTSGSKVETLQLSELTAAAIKIKRKKPKRTKTDSRSRIHVARKKKISEEDFDYCKDDDGTIIWEDGPIDTATGAKLVCHPITSQMFRLADLDEHGGLISTAEPVVRSTSKMQG